MTFHVPANQTVSWSIYKQNIAVETGLPNDFLASQGKRIARAFEYGEPIWMIAAELKICHETLPTWKPGKTPRQLAVRVVRA